MNFIQDVEKLAELKDRGILTEDEFVQKKAELLSQSHASTADATDYDRGVKRNTLDATEKLLIEQRVANEKPSQALAYVLWFFTAPFGGHRFYLGKTGSAIAMLLCTLTILGLVVSILWMIVDLFLIPGMVRAKTDSTRDRLTLRSL